MPLAKPRARAAAKCWPRNFGASLGPAAGATGAAALDDPRFDQDDDDDDDERRLMDELA